MRRKKVIEAPVELAPVVEETVVVVEEPTVVVVEAPLPAGAPVSPTVEELAAVKMNAYAAKVWNGQSPDLPKGERIYRVMNALKDQGFTDTDKLELPNG